MTFVIIVDDNNSGADDRNCWYMTQTKGLATYNLNNSLHCVALAGAFEHGHIFDGARRAAILEALLASRSVDNHLN